MPWPYASYPSALPHVIGVGAVCAERLRARLLEPDAVFNDVAAPATASSRRCRDGLTAERPSCVDQGYSPCGPKDFRRRQRARRSRRRSCRRRRRSCSPFVPKLTPDQVAALIEHSTGRRDRRHRLHAAVPSAATAAPGGGARRPAALESLVREAAARRPLRVERRRGQPSGQRCSATPSHAQGDARLLGRSGRRLQVYLAGEGASRRPPCAARSVRRRTSSSGVRAPSTSRACHRAPDSAPRRARRLPARTSGSTSAAETTGWYYVEVKMGAAGLGPLHAPHRQASMTAVRVGVQLPEVERDVRWPEYVSMAQAAEEVGFDSIWLGDHLLYRGDGREERGPWEAWTLLSALATVTSRVTLGPLVACASLPSAGADREDGGDRRRDLGRSLRPRARRRLGRVGARDLRAARSSVAYRGSRSRSRSSAGCSPASASRSRAATAAADDAVLLPKPARPVPLMAG